MGLGSPLDLQLVLLSLIDASEAWDARKGLGFKSLGFRVKATGLKWVVEVVFFWVLPSEEI